MYYIYILHTHTYIRATHILLKSSTLERKPNIIIVNEKPTLFAIIVDISTSKFSVEEITRFHFTNPLALAKSLSLMPAFFVYRI